MDWHSRWTCEEREEDEHDLKPEDGDETEKDEFTGEELRSDRVNPESAEQEFKAEYAPQEIRAKRMQNPADPSPAERERHKSTHLPCRPRCRTCVKAKGPFKEDRHYRRVKPQLQSELPEVAMDNASLCEAKNKSDKMS